jgi:hypothetical protein
MSVTMLARSSILPIAAVLLAAGAAVAGGQPLAPRPLAGSEALEGALALARVSGERIEVVLVGGDPLAFRTVGARGKLGRPRDLDLTPTPSQIRPLRVARNGLGDWLVSAGNEVRWRRGRQEHSLPLPPGVVVWDVEFLEGQPVAAVTSHFGDGPEVPLLLEWRGREWETLFAEELAPEVAAEHGPRTQHTAAVLAAGSSKSVWIGFAYRHRLLRVNRKGELEREIEVGEGLPDLGEAAPGVEEELAAAAKRLGGPPGRPKAKAFVNTARRQVDGIAEGPDGKLYLLTPGRGEGSSHALERFDSVEGRLERAELTLPFDRGPVRMVAAEDGLVLASENAAGGAWWIGWEAVAEGAWKAVEAVQAAPAVQVAPTASEAVDG